MTVCAERERAFFVGLWDVFMNCSLGFILLFFGLIRKPLTEKGQYLLFKLLSDILQSQSGHQVLP